MIKSISKQVVIFDTRGNNVVINWNDSGNPCRIAGNLFDVIEMPSSEMELLYEALKEMFS
jgi:hypothetical protein